MANYGFIYVDISPARATETLSTAADHLFGSRVRLRVHGSGLLLVEVPSVHPKTAAEANRLWLAAGEPAGFSVEVNPEWEGKPCLAFRHGPSPWWLDWVRGCIEEEMSDRLGVPIIYDASGEAKGPGEHWYRNATTFRGHMTARLGGKLDAADEKFLATHFGITPPEFLD